MTKQELQRQKLRKVLKDFLMFSEKEAIPPSHIKDRMEFVEKFITQYVDNNLLNNPYIAYYDDYYECTLYLPKFVHLMQKEESDSNISFTFLYLERNEKGKPQYVCHHGGWNIDYKVKENDFYSSSKDENLNDRLLKPITDKEEIENFFG